MRFVLAAALAAAASASQPSTAASAGFAAPADGPPCFDELRDIAVTAATNEPLFNVSTRVNNPWFGWRPAPFVVLPRPDALAADVARALSCAASANLTVAVKCGGHGFGGYSAVGASGAFVIAFTNATGVEDASTPDGGAAVRVQAGARYSDVYAFLNDTDLPGGPYVAVGGLCPSVGVAGHVSGGGIGPRGRVHGLASDNLLGFTLVTANGSSVVAANATHNEDLFWAVRGSGGGNFGVLVDLTLRVHPAPPAFTWSLLCYPAADAGAVLAAVAALAPGLPRQANVDVVVDASPGGSACAWSVAGTDAATSNATLAPLLALPSLAANASLVRQYARFWDMLSDYAVAHGYSPFSDTPYRSKNCLVGAPTLAANGSAFAAATAALLATSPPACSQHWIQFGGAVADVAPNATAFPWRSASYMAYSVCSFNDSASYTVADAYLDDWLAAMTPFCDHGATYINFLDSTQTYPGFGSLYYGANGARLLEIKKRWAPPGATPLQFAQEISPLAVGGR
jgi:FAD/FMN-containing dehydrogenase